MNYIDIAVVIFLGYSSFLGYKRGFIKTLFDTLGVIVSFFISRKFYYIVENFLLDNTKMFVKVHGFLDNKLSESLMTTFEESAHIPAELKNVLSNIVNTGNLQGMDSFSVFVDNISIILIRSISFVLTFLVVYAILLIISYLINVVFKLPFLNLANRIFGAGTGIIKGFIILYIIFALCSPPIGFLGDSSLARNVLNSESGKVFYDNNIILNYLSYNGFYNN